mmetsp:Transcript_9290/g.13177  ORF Transcript_9290/g.13177 Transcript_9290/m.13177 type:complete len:103 (+) Transcript_9290:1422-1730(+)
MMNSSVSLRNNTSTHSKKSAVDVDRRKPEAKYLITASRDISNRFHCQWTRYTIIKAWKSVAINTIMLLILKEGNPNRLNINRMMVTKASNFSSIRLSLLIAP